MIMLLIDIYVLGLWLIFFKFKLLKFNLTAKISSAVIGVLLCFGVLIAVNFLHPQSMDARVIQHIIPVAANVPHSGPVTEVAVQPNLPVKAGDILFQVDRRPYELEVSRLEAALAEAEQNVPQLEAALAAATAEVDRLKNQLTFAQIEFDRSQKLVAEQAGTQESLDQATRNLDIAKAALRGAQADEEKARLAANAKTSAGENVAVAQLKAELETAKYNLEQTTVRAPVDGMVVNLELKPGFVVPPGEPVLTFVVNPEGIVVVTLPQEYLSFVEPGNEVEVALDMHPGKMIQGKVDAVVWATGQGQLTPSGTLPSVLEKTPAGRFAVKVQIDPSEQNRYRLPAGAAGAAAIYTDYGKPFRIVRKVVVRWYTWLNYLSLAM
ncbi:MAG TPA: HlyD family secretion protein [Planctomicrobium sp.]|nr:HlyD family secretion protein [Planctomicrobium sp.]